MKLRNEFESMEEEKQKKLIGRKRYKRKMRYSLECLDDVLSEARDVCLLSYSTTTTGAKKETLLLNEKTLLLFIEKLLKP